jgi:hypothetical protein
MVSLVTFGDVYQDYHGQDLGSLTGSWSPGSTAQATGPRTYTVTTSGINAVLLDVTPGVTVNQQNGGVLTYLNFSLPAANNSIKGPSITVEERVGAFAYGAAEANALAALNAYETQSGDATLDQANEINSAIINQNVGISSPDAVAAAISNAAGAAGDSTFANLAQPLVDLAKNWANVEYFLDKGDGCGLQQVQGIDISFGIDRLTVNGATSTWAVSGTTGQVTVSGYTAVSSGDAQTDQFFYNIIDAVASVNTVGSLNVASSGGLLIT